MLFVGATGTGKTTFAKSLLWHRANVVVLDPKRTFRLPPDWPHATYETMAGVRNHQDREGESATIIYRPDPDDLDLQCEDFFAWVFERGNTLLYVDEAAEVSTPTKISKSYSRCLRLGRERGIGTWSATQRPVWIYRAIYTEAEHVFIFRLRDLDDRQAVARFTTKDILAKNPTGHGFYWYNDENQRLRYYRGARVAQELQ